MTEVFNPKGVSPSFIRNARMVSNVFGSGINGKYSEEAAYEEVQGLVPECRLLWAILWRVANDMLVKEAEYSGVSRRGGVKVAARDRKAALKFMMSKRRDAFSFIWICEMLGLSYEEVRKRIFIAYYRSEEERGYGQHGRKRY